MSKIYDALENRNDDTRKTDPISYSARTLPSTGLDLMGIEAEMNALYQTIMHALPGKNHRTVLFVGSRSQEGTSTIARELAKIATSRLEKKVLLVDCEGSCDEFAYQDIDPAVRLEDVLENKTDIEKVLCPVNASGLCILPFFIWAESPRVQMALNENGRFFWDALSLQFDLVIIDYSQEMFTSGPVLTSMVDGVVIVIEAEKTRWQVALSLKEKIINNGGNILGIVFNKRQHYIPQFIYDRL